VDVLASVKAERPFTYYKISILPDIQSIGKSLLLFYAKKHYYLTTGEKRELLRNYRK
jgi:hypothetical protein